MESIKGAEVEFRFITAPRLYWTFVISMFAIGCFDCGSYLKANLWDKWRGSSEQLAAVKAVDELQKGLAEGVEYVKKQQLAKNDKDPALTDDEIDRRIGRKTK